MRWHKQWQYAMYKGEECLAIGTTKEICEQLNISIKTFQYYRSNSYKNRVKNRKSKNYRTIIRLDDD
ncbi:MAG: hypothetical protein J6S85_04455 [Methanobrevibacter sp.]|nr:hypothetical protein [Methanobrevibacter sp.]MBO7712797.1 hypothetical protein [Methanobrevibacter sp.]